MTIGHGGGYIKTVGVQRAMAVDGVKGQDWVVLGCKKDHGLPFHSQTHSYKHRERDRPPHFAQILKWLTKDRQ